MLAACGESEGPDFAVHGLAVIVHSDARFTKHSDFPGRIESTVDQALQYWGGNWSDLQGSTVVFSDDQYMQCGGAGGAIGCYDGAFRISTRDPGLGTWRCVEQTVLVHEVGHAVIGDSEHTDPRWMDFLTVEQKLHGRVGYDETGEAPCQLFVSVWRHILSSP